MSYMSACSFEGRKRKRKKYDNFHQYIYTQNIFNKTVITYVDQSPFKKLN